MKRRKIAIVAIVVFVCAGIVWILNRPPRSPVKSDSPPVVQQAIRDPEDEAREMKMSKIREEMAMTRDKELFGLPRIKQSPEPSFVLPFIGRVTAATTRQESVTTTDPEGRSHTFPLRTFYNKEGYWIRAEYWAKDAEINPRPMEKVEERYGYERIALASTPPNITIEEAIKHAMRRFNLWSGTHFSMTRVIVSFIEPAQRPPRDLVLVELYGATTLDGSMGDPLLNRIRFKIDSELGAVDVDENL